MDFKNFWLIVLQRLEPTITRSKFLTWFQNTAILGVENSTLTLGVPSPYARDWLREKYALKILQACQEQNSVIQEIEFVVDAALNDGRDPRTIEFPAVFGKPGDKKVRKVAGREEVVVTTSGIRSARLNPRYTLANFVPGDDNRLAHAAALSVARAPGLTYNPLFVYGGVGLGKTHLLSAIGHGVVTNNPNHVVVYMTAELFTSEFVAASKRQELDKFKKRYADTDVFLLDDVQFLEGREATQEAFFNLFNTFHTAGKQICVTSDRPPSELTEIMDRLRSRLTWGLVTEIEPPSYHTRLAILKEKAQARRTILDPEVLEFLAMNVTESVRALEGALISALAEIDLLHTQPTIRHLGKLLTKLNKKEKVIGLPENASAVKVRTVAEMMTAVAGYFQLPEAKILSVSREKEFRLARQIAMYLTREILGLRLEAIGQFFSRDHATVLHAVNKIQAGLKSDEVLVRHVNAVKKEIGL